MAQRLSLAFSPCPNDTFMFDALVHHKIDTSGLDFDVHFEDIETLNQHARSSKYDITKLSFPALMQAASSYELLHAGGAFGKAAGPLVVASGSVELNPRTVVAIPGKHTTANFLFSIFFPEVTNKTEMVFSEIESAVLNGAVDAGVIIHENRFTYAKKGLKKIADLGELWQSKTSLPVPLGGIAIRRSLEPSLKQLVDKLLGESIRYAFLQPESSRLFVKEHAQEMEEEVMRKHIETYVNEYSVDAGEPGRDAIYHLWNQAVGAGLASNPPKNIFVESSGRLMNANANH